MNRPDKCLLYVLFLWQLPEVVPEEKTIACPLEVSRDCSQHIYRLGNQVLLCVGGRSEDDVACNRKKEGCHGIMGEGALSTCGGQSSQCPGPSMQLDVFNIQEEVCLRVFVGQKGHVGEPRVSWVGTNQLGKQGNGFVPGKLAKGERGSIEKEAHVP